MHLYQTTQKLAYLDVHISCGYNVQSVREYKIQREKIPPWRSQVVIVE